MSKVNFKFELGDQAQDRVSGVKGIIDMRAEYLNGCLRYSLQPKATKEKPSEIPPSYWVDEGQLKFLDCGLNKTRSVRKSATGGPVESFTSARM